MSRNLIVYKVEYRLKSDPWDRDKFIKTKRIIMTPEEVNQTDGYYHNHCNVKNKFFKQMEDNNLDGSSRRKYSIWRINKA